METLWREEYRLGVEKIDEQHIQLFNKIENLLEIARNKDQESSRKECLGIIDFLIQYTMFHFQTEEQFQRERRYVSYALHVKIHEYFKNTVVAYKELLEKDFSSKNLKSFIGTLITWLVNHVCACDRKIVMNLPIKEMDSFVDAESFLKNVANKLLTEMYGIPILAAKSCIYKGSVEGAVTVRTVAEGNGRYVFAYGMSDTLAEALYNKISGMTLSGIDNMDEIERSALMEIGNIISTYAMSAIEDSKSSRIRFCSDIFIREYNETEYKINNSVILEFATGFGKMEILYCPLK